MTDRIKNHYIRKVEKAHIPGLHFDINGIVSDAFRKIEGVIHTLSRAPLDMNRRGFLKWGSIFGASLLAACKPEEPKPEDDPRVMAIPQQLEPIKAYESDKAVDARIEQLIKELRDELGTPTDRRVFDKNRVAKEIPRPLPRPEIITPTKPAIQEKVIPPLPKARPIPEVLPPAAPPQVAILIPPTPTSTPPKIEVPQIHPPLPEINNAQMLANLFAPMANPQTLMEKRRELQKIFIQHVDVWANQSFLDLDAEHKRVMELTDKAQSNTLNQAERQELDVFLSQYEKHADNYGELRAAVGRANTKLILLKKYPRLFTAIAAEESQWGSSNWARTANNYCGLQRPFTSKQQERYKKDPDYKREMDKQYLITGNGKRLALRYDHPSESIRSAIENLILSKNSSYQAFFEALRNRGSLSDEVLLHFAKGYNEHPEKYLNTIKSHMGKLSSLESGTKTG